MFLTDCLPSLYLSAAKKMLNLDRQHQLIISHALLLCHSEFLMSCGLGRSSITLMPIHGHEHDNMEEMHDQAARRLSFDSWLQHWMSEAKGLLC
jgi:hypothetical protein